MSLSCPVTLEIRRPPASGFRAALLLLLLLLPAHLRTINGLIAQADTRTGHCDGQSAEQQSGSAVWPAKEFARRESASVSVSLALDRLSAPYQRAPRRTSSGGKQQHQALAIAAELITLSCVCACLTADRLVVLALAGLLRIQPPVVAELHPALSSTRRVQRRRRRRQ